MTIETSRISVVTPTFRRPEEVRGLLDNLSRQTLIPSEVIFVDGAPAGERDTEEVVASMGGQFPFEIIYIRHAGGTAIQRNIGIDAARHEFIAMIDDDVRLEPEFFSQIAGTFLIEGNQDVGGIVGYRTNQHFKSSDSQRWRWYKRLDLLKTFEPGRYDFATGYPINNNMQPAFLGTRPVDFMTTACAVWRRDVFESGLRFDPFFSDYGVLEDAHFSLRAGRAWKLLQLGDARCEELNSPNGRVGRRILGYKCVVNYYFVFNDIAGPLTKTQKFRFWRYQMFEIFRIGTSAIRRRNWGDVSDLHGRVEGIMSVIRGTSSKLRAVDPDLTKRQFSAEKS